MKGVTSSSLAAKEPPVSAIHAIDAAKAVRRLEAQATGLDPAEAQRLHALRASAPQLEELPLPHAAL